MSSSNANYLTTRPLTRSGSSSGCVKNNDGTNNVNNKNNNIDAISQQLASIVERLNNIEKNITDTIKKEVGEKIAKIIETFNNKIDAMETVINKNAKKHDEQIAAINQQLSNNSTLQNNKLQMVDDRVKTLETTDRTTGNDEHEYFLDRLSHISDLVITGVPSHCNDLSLAFDNICKAISINLDHHNIGSIFRVKNGAIIVKFFAMGAKQTFFWKYLKFAKLNLSHIGFTGTSRIYINESLCRRTVQLLKSANKMRKDGILANTFTIHGLLFVKRTINGTAIKITTLDQLHMLARQPKSSSVEAGI